MFSSRASDRNRLQNNCLVDATLRMFPKGCFQRTRLDHNRLCGLILCLSGDYIKRFSNSKIQFEQLSNETHCSRRRVRRGECDDSKRVTGRPGRPQGKIPGMVIYPVIESIRKLFRFRNLRKFVNKLSMTLSEYIRFTLSRIVEEYISYSSLILVSAQIRRKYFKRNASYYFQNVLS